MLSYLKIARLARGYRHVGEGLEVADFGRPWPVVPVLFTS